MANKPATPPNTSHILTQAKVDYINQHHNGSKSAAIHAALGAMMNYSQLYAQARERVDNTPELRQYREIILDDWNEANEHLTCVITAPVEDIVDWADEIESNLEDAPAA